MKIKVCSEKVFRENGKTTLLLFAKVVKSDPRELDIVIPNKRYRVVGVSKCCPGDAYDELTGYRLARSRAYKSLYKIVLRETEDLFRKIEDNLGITADSVGKYDNALYDQEQEINRLINE